MPDYATENSGRTDKCRDKGRRGNIRTSFEPELNKSKTLFLMSELCLKMNVCSRNPRLFARIRYSSPKHFYSEAFTLECLSPEAITSASCPISDPSYFEITSLVGAFSEYTDFECVFSRQKTVRGVVEGINFQIEHKFSIYPYGYR